MDLINRQDAIEICDAMANFWDGTSGVTGIWSVRNEIAKLEPAQPDLESAYAEGYTAAEAEFHKLMDAQESDVARDIATIIENERDMRVILKNAEHTETHESRREWYMKGYRDAQNAALHESCTDCPLYDHDRHSCPRFNHVIPTAILDAQQPRWIPIKWHDCTDEEREEYGFAEEIVAVFDCDMPNDNQEILVTTSHGYVEKDVCYIDDGYSLDSGYDWIEDITAWMPLPPVYEGGQDEQITARHGSEN